MISDERIERLSKLSVRNWSTNVCFLDVETLIERLRSAEDALRFYQHEANWIIPAGVGDYSDYLSAMCPVQDDGGKKARQHFDRVRGDSE